MTEVNKTKVEEQKAFFQECMELAGYKSYRDLAEDIILSLPPNVDLTDEVGMDTIRRNLAATIGGLANGNKSPIFYAGEDKGKMRPLAIEIASLLSVDPETLFSTSPELAYSSIEMWNAEEEIDDRFDMTPDINLIRRDIIKALDTLKEEHREVLLHLVLWGRTQAEIVVDMSCKPSQIQSLIPIAKKAWENRVRNALKDYQDPKNNDNQFSQFNNVGSYLDLPNSFKTSRLTTEFAMDAARIKNLLDMKHGIDFSLSIKLRKDLDRAFQAVERLLSLPTPLGSILSSSKGAEISSLLTCYAALRHSPSSEFMSAVEGVTKRNKGNYFSSWAGTEFEFMGAIKSIADNFSGQNNHPVRQVCERILSIK